MKTEEYIETIVSAHSDMRWMDASELRTILTSVMDMARKEEREKAIELHMKYCGDYRCPSNKQSFGNNQCSGNCLIMESFKNDLEK